MTFLSCALTGTTFFTDEVLLILTAMWSAERAHFLLRYDGFIGKGKWFQRHMLGPNNKRIDSVYAQVMDRVDKLLRIIDRLRLQLQAGPPGTASTLTATARGGSTGSGGVGSVGGGGGGSSGGGGGGDGQSRQQQQQRRRQQQQAQRTGCAEATRSTRCFRSRALVLVASIILLHMVHVVVVVVVVVVGGGGATVTISDTASSIAAVSAGGRPSATELAAR